MGTSVVSNWRLLTLSYFSVGANSTRARTSDPKLADIPDLLRAAMGVAAITCTYDIIDIRDSRRGPALGSTGRSLFSRASDLPNPDGKAQRSERLPHFCHCDCRALHDTVVHFRREGILDL